MNHQTSSVPQIAYQSPQASTQPMTESPLVDSGFVVPVFSLRDDLISCLNKAMYFLTVVASSRFPSTNNQLRTSSNLINQATVQQVQERQGQNYSGTGYKSNATSSEGNTANRQARTEDLDTYDSDCDDISNAKVILMANISNYDFDVILEVVQIVLWYLDSGCLKHMTGNRSQLMNFVSKFLGTVRFKNNHIVRIMGYGDYQLGNVTISRVYYIEGLGHNLFSVGQFCDADLEVAFRKKTCFIRNLKGVDLISGSRDTNLYTISLDDMIKTSLICLLSKASKTKSWLWHRRLSHLNFACALGKIKKSSHQPKVKDINQEKLYLLHMNLCGPMRVASINGKMYILVIVNDYSRFTWVRFLRSKDEAPEAIIKCIKNIQVRLNATVLNV
nr:retrovirus-related Pol polyprotein from transposon TNT 1-94 [Tanacetum cinerariifolium]